VNEAKQEAVPQWLVRCTSEIRRQPLTALIVASAAGFVLGGGLRSRLGRRMFAVAGSTLARSIMVEMTSELLRSDGRDDVRP
jgi:hypothetical protein